MEAAIVASLGPCSPRALSPKPYSEFQAIKLHLKKKDEKPKVLTLLPEMLVTEEPTSRSYQKQYAYSKIAAVERSKEDAWVLTITFKDGSEAVMLRLPTPQQRDEVVELARFLSRNMPADPSVMALSSATAALHWSAGQDDEGERLDRLSARAAAASELGEHYLSTNDCSEVLLLSRDKSRDAKAFRLRCLGYLALAEQLLNNADEVRNSSKSSSNSSSSKGGREEKNDENYDEKEVEEEERAALAAARGSAAFLLALGLADLHACCRLAKPKAPLPSAVEPALHATATALAARLDKAGAGGGVGVGVGAGDAGALAAGYLDRKPSAASGAKGGKLLSKDLAPSVLTAPLYSGGVLTLSAHKFRDFAVDAATRRALAGVVEIQLGECHLHDLDGAWFSGLAALRVLILARNKIEAVAGTLSNLPALQQLDLAHNRIADLAPVLALLAGCATSPLRALWLHGNPCVSRLAERQDVAGLARDYRAPLLLRLPALACIDDVDINAGERREALVLQAAREQGVLQAALFAFTPDPRVAATVSEAVGLACAGAGDARTALMRCGGIKYLANTARTAPHPDMQVRSLQCLAFLLQHSEVQACALESPRQVFRAAGGVAMLSDLLCSSGPCAPAALYAPVAAASSVVLAAPQVLQEALRLVLVLAANTNAEHAVGSLTLHPPACPPLSAPPPVAPTLAAAAAAGPLPAAAEMTAARQAAGTLTKQRDLSLLRAYMARQRTSMVGVQPHSAGACLVTRVLNFIEDGYGQAESTTSDEERAHWKTVARLALDVLALLLLHRGPGAACEAEAKEDTETFFRSNRGPVLMVAGVLREGRLLATQPALAAVGIAQVS